MGRIVARRLPGAAAVKFSPITASMATVILSAYMMTMPSMLRAASTMVWMRLV